MLRAARAALYVYEQRMGRTSASRSFIIPVLDDSPASPFGIETLLADLEDIPGDVLVVFNDARLAARLGRHRRITRFATMSQNVGVPRAWNVGLELATTPAVFFLNADLHIERAAADAIERGLRTLPKAACAGPEGSFFDVRRARDHLHLERGDVHAPVEVDAVSGFLFAVHRAHFGPGGFRFEDDYTPCWFEEWDLGLQIRRAGLKSWLVPTVAYEHTWGGTLGRLRTVPYLGRRERLAEIGARNRVRFCAKWKRLARAEPALLESGIVRYARGLAVELLAARRHEEAIERFRGLADASPRHAALAALAGFVHALGGQHAPALAWYRRASRLDKYFDVSSFIDSLTRALARAARARP